MSLPSDPAVLRAIHARSRAWADVLRLPFRQKKWKGQTGEFMGGGVGSSLDFQDHRAYLPGDDPRQINWQAYARTGTYSMKLYREEVRPLVDLVFDVSDSMFAFPAKAVRALELFYYAVEGALQAGSTVKIFVVKGGDHRLLPEDAVLGHRWPAEVERLSPAAASDPPAIARLPLRAGAMRVLISDLLFPAAPEPFVQALTVRSGRGLVFAPYSHEEAAPGWDGNYEFIDSESQSHHLHRVEPDLLERYHLAYRRHYDLWKACAQKHGAALARVSAEAEFQPALQAEALPAGAVEL